MRLTIRSNVVLPQPLEPTSTVIEPVGAIRLKSFTAVVPPAYSLDTESNRIIGDPLRGKRVGYPIQLRVSTGCTQAEGKG